MHRRLKLHPGVKPAVIDGMRMHHRTLVLAAILLSWQSGGVQAQTQADAAATSASPKSAVVMAGLGLAVPVFGDQTSFPVEIELGVMIRNGHLGIPISVIPSGGHTAVLFALNYHPQPIDRPGPFIGGGLGTLSGYRNSVTVAFVDAGLVTTVYHGYLRPVLSGRAGRSVNGGAGLDEPFFTGSFALYIAF
jgi:hypothetical protein